MRCRSTWRSGCDTGLHSRMEGEVWRARLQPALLLSTYTAVMSGPASAHHVEHPGPAGLVKEMDHDGKKELKAFRNTGPCVLIPRLLERPIEKHRASDHVLKGNESPITAVKADVAIIAHCEDAVGRNHQFAILDMRRQFIAPFCSQAIIVRRGDRREIVAIAHVRAVANDKGLVKLFAIAIDHTVLETDTVSGHADYTLHNVESRLCRRDENKNVIMLGVAVGNERLDPTGFGREQNAVDEDVVANEEGVFHGAGRNDESLQREGDDEQAGYQYGGNGGDEFGRRFPGLLGRGLLLVLC